MTATGGATATDDALAGETMLAGGSVTFTHRSANDQAHALPTGVTGSAVHEVAVEGLTANGAVEAKWLVDGYGTQDLRADGDGILHTWLPDGHHYIWVNGRHYEATVNGADTTAVLLTGTWFVTGVVTNPVTGEPVSG